MSKTSPNWAMSGSSHATSWIFWARNEPERGAVECKRAYLPRARTVIGNDIIDDQANFMPQPSLEVSTT